MRCDFHVRTLGQSWDIMSQHWDICPNFVPTLGHNVPTLSQYWDIMSQLCPDVRTYVPTCSDIVKSMILRRKVVENIRKVSNRCILSIKWPFVYSVCGRLMGSIAETLCINPEQKIFSFDSVLPSESCLRASLPPKTGRKIFQIFFLCPHWNSLAESKFHDDWWSLNVSLKKKQ